MPRDRGGQPRQGTPGHRGEAPGFRQGTRHQGQDACGLESSWDPPYQASQPGGSPGTRQGRGSDGGGMPPTPHLHPPPPPLSELKPVSLSCWPWPQAPLKPSQVSPSPGLTFPAGVPPGLPDVPSALAATPDACSTTGNPAGTEASSGQGKGTVQGEMEASGGLSPPSLDLRTQSPRLVWSRPSRTAGGVGHWSPGRWATPSQAGRWAEGQSDRDGARPSRGHLL